MKLPSLIKRIFTLGLIMAFALPLAAKPGPLPSWITPPPPGSIVTQALVTLQNPITGETYTVPTGGYTVNISDSDSQRPETGGPDPRPEVERPDPRVEEYRKLEKWLDSAKAEAAKAERDLEVKIAELRKNPDKNEVEIGIKKARSEHDAKMARHAGERKNLEDRLAELKKPFEVVLNLSDYHLDPSLSKWAEHLPKTPYGLIVKGVWCHTLWDPAGLQVSEMALTTPTDK